MLLAIDLGNTDTKLGVFGRDGARGFSLRKTWRITTARRRTADEYGLVLAALFRRAEIPQTEVAAIIVSSVVPQHDGALEEACRSSFGCAPAFFSAASQSLIEVATDRPKELGSDLLTAAIAARARYGSPAIVVGFGTATTFGAVSRDGRYLGAAIAPGIGISIDALVERTAKLPQVALVAPSSVIGRDTVAALQSGIVYGFVGQTEALVARMKREIGEDAHVVATGGLAEIVARHTSVLEAVEPHLVLEGLRLVYEQAIGPN